MLLNFSVSNFKSFDEKVTFSMLPGKISKQHKDHVIEDKPFNALKGACLYGPNASGKTNLVSAIAFLQSYLFGVSTKTLLSRQYKLNNFNETSFEIDFLINKKAYRYELITDGIDILFERYSILQKSGNIKPLFTRNKLEIKYSDEIKKSKSFEWYNNRTFKTDTTLVSKLREDGIIDNSKKIFKSEHFLNLFNFSASLIILDPNSSVHPYAFGQYLTQDDFREYLQKLLKFADVGISDISWHQLSSEDTERHINEYIRLGGQINNNEGTVFYKDSLMNFIAIDLNPNGEKRGYTLKTLHNDTAFELKDESSGTIRLIDLALNFFILKEHDVCLIIDEMDCRLHPFLAKFLIQSHMQNNNQKGQLIVTLHDVSLMDNEIWRSDEVWFTEKRVEGSTDLYSLYQFKPRFDKSLSKGYMEGMYGAIPMIGNIDDF